MFSSVIYLELFVAFFFLPGFFITVILGIKKFRFLLSFAFSYSLLVLTLLPFEYYAQPIVRWQWWVLSEWVILAASAVVKTFMSWSSKTLNIQLSTSNSEKGDLDPMLNVQCWTLKVTANIIRLLFCPRLIVPLVLAGVICGYLAYAGPYLEIPSDTWGHIFKFQWQKLCVIDNDAFPSDSSFSKLFLNQGSGSHWYFIHTWLCHVSELPIMDSLHVLTFVNVLIFLLGFYYFGLFLFANVRISAFRKMMIASIASLFAAATMGNMVFAYIRYYAFAPTILNYVLFLAAMTVIIAWLRSARWFGSAHHRWFGHALWMAPVLLIVISMIHTQELLFVFFMTLALGIVGCLSLCWRKFFNLARHSHNCSVREWKTVILATVLLLMFFAGFAVIRHFKPGTWISANMIMPHVSIPSEPVNFIFNKLLISPPRNPLFRLAVYQLFIFYQVVGCWGLFVYLLFLLMIRHFVKIPYLPAGMVVVPLLTAFNPLTIDMMARMGQDMTLYRFHYLIPLPFVGGYLFVHFFGKVREWLQKMRAAPAESEKTATTKRGPPIYAENDLFWKWRDALCRVHGTFIVSSWINFVGSILVLAGLIGLVFPINVAGIYAPYSKVWTLRKLPAGNDYHLCDDMGKIMAKYENKIILTDGWTGGLLWFYSPKNTGSYVKWLNSSNPEKEPPEPYTWEKLRNRGLIVINRRNGGLSITGRIARHWPEDAVPKVSRYYSLETQHYLESHPEKFRKIWSQNQIAVYAVR